MAQEREINEELFRLLNARESFVFEAGAGSGKTYSLVECLRHIVRTDGNKLESRGQKVACITYTNVAAQEIRKRLGASQVIHVSTIHDFLWPKMKPFQRELVAIHREKMEAEMKRTKDCWDKEDKYKTFASMEECQKELLMHTLWYIRQEFYESKRLGANDFRDIMTPLLPNSLPVKELLKNKGNFVDFASGSIRVVSYEECVALIDAHEEGFNGVAYDPTVGTDRLERMQFSHDTLLTYAKELAETSEMFRRSLLDAFPFVLVDEYQDTSENVIQLMELLRQEAKKLDRDFVVGYYGDSAQSIYGEGAVGSGLSAHAASLTTVVKPYNRRSCCEIIEAGNRIRRDNIKQESIFDDAAGGSVELFVPEAGQSLSDEVVRHFIEKTAQEFHVSEKDPLDCFVLTKSKLASLCNFGELYNKMRDMAYFKEHAKSLGEEFVVADPSRLNKASRLLFNLTSFKRRLADESTLLSEFGLIPGPGGPYFTIDVLEKTISALRSLVASSPSAYLDVLENYVSSLNTGDVLRCTNRVLDKYLDGSYLKNVILSSLTEELFPHAEDVDIAKAKENIEELLSIPFDEYYAWCDYVCSKNAGAIRYHTYHGTKGEEYDSVLIIGENKFSRKRIFEEFYKAYGKAVEDEKKQKMVEEGRNLLYVVTTRAKKRLRVLHIMDVEEFKTGIEAIYGEAERVGTV